jgi:hypothetical protein
MPKTSTSFHTAALGAVIGVALVLLTVALWQLPPKAAQAAPDDSFSQSKAAGSANLSSSFDIWQAGQLQIGSDVGLYPDPISAVAANFQVGDYYPLTTTVMGVVGAAPLTATVATARIMLDREPSSLTSGIVNLAVCEGDQVNRIISITPLAVDTVPERIWLDVPLAVSPAALTIAPSEYLCWIGVRTAPGTINVNMTIQAAVRYWADPTDYVYLSSISQ